MSAIERSRRLLLPLAGLALVALAGLWLAGALSPGGAGPWTQLVVWLFEQQGRFHRSLTDQLGGLRGLTGAAAVPAAAGLLAASFLYGLFHAAGPGHGKAVIATYLLTQEGGARAPVRRGVALAVAASLCQGLVALLLVYGLVGLAGWLPRESSVAVAWSERLSYGLVAGVGLLLLLRAARGLWRASRPAQEHGQTQGQAHGHTHGHTHEHGGDAACCAHGPSADQLARAGDWRTALGIVLSIGLRPCSGAIVVLVFARVVDIAWAGVAAVAVLSLGTAIAVSVLAWAAVHARDAAHGFLERSERLAGRLAVIGRCAGLLGGLVILALGLSLLSGSFAPRHPLGLG